MREREKEIGEGEPLWETRVKGLSTTMERSLKGLSKVSSNLSKSFLMVAKKLALQRSFAEGCKVVAAAISMRAPFTHRSSWGTASVTKNILHIQVFTTR